MRTLEAQRLRGLAIAITGLSATAVVAAGQTGTKDTRICWEAEKTAALQKPIERMPPTPSADKIGERRFYSGGGYLEIPIDPNPAQNELPVSGARPAISQGQAVYKINVTH